MASARVETVQPEPPPRKVILELSEEEAGAIFAVTGHIGGSGRLRDEIAMVFFSLLPLFEHCASPFEQTWVPMVRSSAPIPKIKP